MCIPGVKKIKLYNKTEKLLFVGYCEDSKAYHFLNPVRNSTVISWGARFIELGNGSLMEVSAEDSIVECFGDDTLFQFHEEVAATQKEDKYPADEEPWDNDVYSDDEFYVCEEAKASTEEEIVEPSFQGSKGVLGLNLPAKL